MMQLLHTLYVTEPDVSLHLEGDALVAIHISGQKDHVPLHMLESIVTFSYEPATPALLSACARRGIGVVFLSRTGEFRFRVQGKTQANILLRKNQYLLSEELRHSLAKRMLQSKIVNSAQLLARFRRNHGEINAGALSGAEAVLRAAEGNLAYAENFGHLRGIEGSAAKAYFDVFDSMILPNMREFRFAGRSRRPPLDRCNALLSYTYTLLTADCVQALECAGLDPYVGFLHGVRPGKPALALDLMEEFRPIAADRLVLYLINMRMIKPEQFTFSEEGGVYLNGEGRRILLKEWNRRKWEEVNVPELGQKVPQGLLPHLQARRLASFLRGEDEAYHSLHWG